LGTGGRPARLAATPKGAFLCCIFWQELWLGALPPLPKAIGAGLAAGPKVVGYGSHARPKTLPKGAPSVGFYCLGGPKSNGSTNYDITTF